MITLVSIVVLLGALIFVHELGHFLVAKWAGVKVEVFSLGFGKKILKKQVGETEYCLSLFPLGGYVKMFGDDPTVQLPVEERRRSFLAQPLGKRFLIVIAGPAFNLFFAMFLFFLIPVIGEEVAVPRVAMVGAGTQADSVGLKVGDEVIAIDGSNVDRTSDLQLRLIQRVDRPVRLTVKREGQSPFFVEVRPREVTGRDVFGDPALDAEVPGLSFTAPGTFIGVDSSRSWAAELGLETGDLISKINGVEVHLWPKMVEHIRTLGGQKVSIEVVKKNGLPHTLEGTVPENLQLGLYHIDLFVRELVSQGPAERAGILSGDRIVEVNGESVGSFDQFKSQVAQAGESGRKLLVTVVRDGERVTFEVVPESKEIENPITHQKTRQWIVGLVAAGNQDIAAEVRTVRITSPLRLLKESVERSWDKTALMMRGFWKLISGQSSMKALGGPILIADLAGRTARLGVVRFLELMAFISINLFLINLFPVPVLDGGHIFLFMAYELFARRQMPLRWMERFNQLGFAVILLLMVVTIVNDISRFKPGLFPFLR